MNKHTFLQSVMVIDTETTNLKAEIAEIVEVAGAFYNGSDWAERSMLLKPLDGNIPPEASAKTHISNRMVADKGTFAESVKECEKILGFNSKRYLVAHNSKYDQAVLHKAWKDAKMPDFASRSEDQTQWICTYRLSKKLLDFDFKDMQYNLNYLRYKLDLPVSDELPAHRAGSDVIVCAALFEFLIEYAIMTDKATDDNTLDEQIHKLCWSPTLYKNWPFGKHKGQDFSAIPTDYYSWAIDNMDVLNEKHPDYNVDLAAPVATELEKRL